MGYGGYQMFQQLIGDLDDDEDILEIVDLVVLVDISGVIVDVDVERSIIVDEVSRLLLGLFVVGGIMLFYMKVLKLNVDGYIYYIILLLQCIGIFQEIFFKVNGYKYFYQ